MVRRDLFLPNELLNICDCFLKSCINIPVHFLLCPLISPPFLLVPLFFMWLSSPVFVALMLCLKLVIPQFLHSRTAGSVQCKNSANVFPNCVAQVKVNLSSSMEKLKKNFFKKLCSTLLRDYPAISSTTRSLLNGPSENESISCRPTSGHLTVSLLCLKLWHLLLRCLVHCNRCSHLHWSTVLPETRHGGPHAPHSGHYSEHHNAGR